MNNRILNVALVFCFFLFHTAIEAQLSIDWASEFKSKGYVKTLGNTDEFFFLLDTKQPTPGNTFDKNEGEIEIIKFDQDLEYIESFKVKDVFGKWRKIVDIYITEEKFYALLFNEEKPKSQYLEKVEIDPNNMEQISTEKVYSFKQKYEYAPFGYYSKSARWFGAKNSITVFNSFTRKNTILTINNGNGSKFADRVFLVYNRDSFYNLVNEFNITFDRKKTGWKQLVDYSVRDNGDMTILIQQYNTKLARPRKKGKMTYKFKILRKPANGTTSEIVFDTDDNYVIDPSLKMESDGSVYFTAFYQESFQNRPKNFGGFYQVKLDKTNKIIYKKKTAFSETSQSSRNKDDYYDLLFTSIVDDKLLVVTQNKPNSFSQPHKIQYENIYFDLFDKSGKYHSTAVLYDNTKGEKAYFWDDQVLMIFGNVPNEEINNMDTGFTKHRKKASKENFIVASIFQPNKKIEHIRLNGPEKIYSNVIAFHRGQFYIIGSDLKKFRLGKLVSE